MSECKKIRIGVVGGSFGTSFYWHEHPNCVVAAVADLDPERLQNLKNTYHCDNGFATMEEMLKEAQIDAVAVFSGAPDHVRQSVACMKAGKHVISAVPACMSLEEADLLRDTVEKTGLTYMMAETSYYRQNCISARKFFDDGKFGEIFYTEAEYHHAGIDPLFFDKEGKRTWRYGIPPMLYPTHCTGFLVGVTRERLTHVSCIGWGDDSPYLKDNSYNNPFWCETALFQTDKGHAFRAAVYWEGAVRGCERAQWYGTKMSFFSQSANGQGPVIVRRAEEQETDDAGFVRTRPRFEEYEQPKWFETDMLPEPMRHDSGHGGSHVFLANEFINALVEERAPAIDVYEALAMTVPGIVAHQSALRDGERLKVPSFDRA